MTSSPKDISCFTPSAVPRHWSSAYGALPGPNY